MDEFSAEWLAAREAADRRSRSRDLANAFLSAVQKNSSPMPTLIDLGCGSGNNAAWLTSLEAAPVSWHLIDANAELLELAGPRLIPAPVQTSNIDFADAASLRPALERAVGLTCSALLDLVSARWLDGFVKILAERPVPVLASLTYSGGMTFDPVHPHDDVVIAAFNLHQTSDKGLGAALGPAAATRFQKQLGHSRYLTSVANTPWALGPADGPMTSRLIIGIGEAAGEAAAGDDKATVAAWYRSRLRQIDALHITVSHVDVLGIPVDPPGD